MSQKSSIFGNLFYYTVILQKQKCSHFYNSHNVCFVAFGTKIHVFFAKMGMRFISLCHCHNVLVLAANSMILNIPLHVLFTF